MLEFEPLRKSADQEAKLLELEGHMRVVYSVPKHRRNQTERALQVNESSIFPLESFQQRPLSRIQRQSSYLLIRLCFPLFMHRGTFPAALLGSFSDTFLCFPSLGFAGFYLAYYQFAT